MQRVAVLIAHQCETARQHAAIGQRGQQLAAMGDARIEPLQDGGKRAPRPFGEPVGALAVACDGLALGLRIGKLRRFQPHFEPRIAITAVA